MKRTLILAAALALTAAAPAMAQDDHHGEGHPGGSAPHPAAAPHAPPAGAPGGYHGPQAQPGGYHGPQGGAQPGYRGAQGGGQPGGGYRGASNANAQGGGYGRGGDNGYRGGTVGGNRAAYRGGVGGYGGGGYPRGYDNGVHGGYAVGGRGPGGYGGGHGPGQFEFHGRNFSSFRAAPFYYPRGYGYQRWYAGGFLPGLFLGGDYYIGDWGAYDLGPPPPGEHWVRYGPDALLVNNYNGQIDDVVYGVFYW